jgi:hypothetical protein
MSFPEFKGVSILGSYDAVRQKVSPKIRISKGHLLLELG